ncbi:CLUMA_CG008575, isoform A [Clunio marinus]|uniref:CLUMA_CG008575, isoform A n=1 Tax=Clunio marinus TaxID=568069 RepID=A0A1J1I9I7_9DIPT|nr:CLUMA_CG008575, isoform A [Clunio marinus]
MKTYSITESRRLEAKILRDQSESPKSPQSIVNYNIGKFIRINRPEFKNPTKALKNNSKSVRIWCLNNINDSFSIFSLFVFIRPSVEQLRISVPNRMENSFSQKSIKADGAT